MEITILSPIKEDHKTKGGNMQVVARKGFLALMIVCVFMMFAAAACDDTVKNAYKTLFIAGTTYDTGMKAVADLQKQGKVTADQRKEINTYASKFYGSYQIAVVLLQQYNKTKDANTQTMLASAITKFLSEWTVLAGYVNRIVPGSLTPQLEVTP
jgi:hypothetical protein